MSGGENEPVVDVTNMSRDMRRPTLVGSLMRTPIRSVVLVKACLLVSITVALVDGMATAGTRPVFLSEKASADGATAVRSLRGHRQLRSA